MTPHLFSLPVKLMTILPALWSSTISNSPMYPCFIMTVRNLMITLEQGRTSTCLLPRFSALLMHFKQSASESIRTILAVFSYFSLQTRTNHSITLSKLFRISLLSVETLKTRSLKFLDLKHRLRQITQILEHFFSIFVLFQIIINSP